MSETARGQAAFRQEDTREEFIRHLVPALFRAVRLHFGDHQRAAEFTEIFIAEAVAFRERDGALSPVDILEEGVREAARRAFPGAGRGLSGKQRTLLKKMAESPPLERLCVDFLHFQRVSPEVVQRLLKISAGEARNMARKFLENLRKDRHDKEMHRGKRKFRKRPASQHPKPESRRRQYPERGRHHPPARRKRRR